MYNEMSLAKIKRSVKTTKSAYLKREVELELFVPSDLLGNEQVHLLLLNDGQDAEALQLEPTLNELYSSRKIDPVVIVGIKTGAGRLDEYGVSGRPDFLNRGSKAGDYTDFVIKELLPFVKKECPFINGRSAIAGFSLGGLSAFDIAWNNGANFDLVGAFSPSFWWRRKDLSDGYTPDDRICQAMIRESVHKPDLKFWLMTGTEDEKADRNHNFIIDSIDDTIDVIKELLAKGYQRQEDITYYEMVGGEHNQHSWGKALPCFLIWAFSYKGPAYTPIGTPL